MDKIDKLKKLLELSQNDTITPKEVEQFLTMVLGFIKKSKDEFESLSAENLKTISDSVAYLEGKFTNTLDDKINTATGQMEANVSELKALIAKVKTIKPVDGIDGVNPDPEDVVPLVLAKLPKVEPFTVKRDEVVKEINTGKKGDTKIELEQIEGVDKLEKGVLDRAVSILDQRTKFLVNKSVKHDATMTGSGTDADPLSVVGGGGAVDSVNGQTGVVVLDTDDIAEGSTNKYWKGNTRTLIVDQGGLGDYTTIKDACDYVATQTRSSSLPWQIFVMTGLYLESPFTVPTFTTVNGFIPTTWGNFESVTINMTTTFTSGTGITLNSTANLANMTVYWNEYTGAQTGDIDLVLATGNNKITGVYITAFTSDAATITALKITGGTFYSKDLTVGFDNFGAGGARGIYETGGNFGGLYDQTRVYSFTSNHWCYEKDTTAGASRLYNCMFEGPSSVKRTGTGTVTLRGTSYVANSGTVAYENAFGVADEAYGAGWDGSQEVPTKNALYDKIETLGNVTKVGTPINNQVGVWTGDGTIEGDADLTFDTTTDTLSTTRILLGDGSGASPAYSFTNATGIGMYNGGGNELTFDGNTHLFTINGTNFINLLSNKVNVAAATILGWGTIGGTMDAGISRTSAGLLKVNDGTTGYGDLEVADDAYGAGWNGSQEVPTKNALYDKIETITAGAGITRTITTSSGSFTAGSSSATDYVYLIAGAHAVALPTAVGNTNRYTFKNNHSAAITITPDGVETIEGSATIQVAPEDSVDLISNNSVWFVI